MDIFFGDALIFHHHGDVGKDVVIAPAAVGVQQILQTHIAG